VHLQFMYIVHELAVCPNFKWLKASQPSFVLDTQYSRIHLSTLPVSSRTFYCLRWIIWTVPIWDPCYISQVTQVSYLNQSIDMLTSRLFGHELVMSCKIRGILYEKNRDKSWSVEMDTSVSWSDTNTGYQTWQSSTYPEEDTHRNVLRCMYIEP